MKESESLLQRFFDASLIPSETTDERLQHYQAAAADLAKRFVEKPSDAVSASRVAIDPNCPATDPCFNGVQDAVKTHWKTFLANNHDAPRQICRAILLEALSKAVEEDWDITSAVWNGASNLLPHIGQGPEQAITRAFINGLGDECELNSSELWATGKAASEDLPEFEIKLAAVKPVQVDEDELTAGFAAAAGPNNAQGRINGGNPHWPQNDLPNWVSQFSTRASKTVATAVNKAIVASSPPVKGFADQLAPALKKYAKELRKWMVDSVQRNERSTALLWWREAFYSPSLRRSYRQLSSVGMVIAMPFDLASISSAPVPQSVEYFLRETIRGLLPENPKFTLAELVSASRQSEDLVQCLPKAPEGDPHRVSLREFLARCRLEAAADARTVSYVGIPSSIILPASEWAVWLLRERMAEILAAPPA